MSDPNYHPISPGGGSGDMLKADNLSGLANTATARTNIGLGNVDNTSDANKPVSTAQQTALDAKQNAATAVTADNAFGTDGLPLVSDGTGRKAKASNSINVDTLTTSKVLISPPSVDGTATGPQTSAFVSGYSSSAVGDLVYLDSAGKWQKVDANSVYNGLLGIALEVKAADAALLVALPGSFVYATAFPTLTIGGPVYASETAGAITQTAPTTTDSATRVIGHAVHADKIYFDPDNIYTTHV